MSSTAACRCDSASLESRNVTSHCSCYPIPTTTCKAPTSSFTLRVRSPKASSSSLDEQAKADRTRIFNRCDRREKWTPSSGENYTRKFREDAPVRIVTVLEQQSLPQHSMFHSSASYRCHVLVHYEVDVEGNTRIARHLRRVDIRLTRKHVFSSSRFIIAALPPHEHPSSGVYQMIRMLRAQTLDPEALQPIVIVSENDIQDQHLLLFMALFPDVYYIQSSLERPNALLRECIERSCTLVVIASWAGSEHDIESKMADTQAILSAQNAFSLYPWV
eukprot:m.73162 g.73162  ORF g.73162 m.73162 type:complete len:275 (-) comp8025_c0_seq3:1400-2224(-)